MFNCYIFFDDAMLNGKFSSFIGNIQPSMKIISALDTAQILLTEDDHNILLSDEKGLEKLKDQLNNFDKCYIFKSGSDDIEGKIHYIDPKFVITKMGTYLSEYIQEQSSEEQYLPININKITYNINYPSNFYLKLGQSKFLKVSNANDSLEEKILQKLIFKGTKYLYVLFSEYPLLLKYLTKQKMAKSKTLQSAEQEVKATQTMHEYITELGFDPKVINMTKDLHKSLEDKFKGKFMKSLLLQFANLEGTFIYNHSYLTSVLALTVGKNYTWMNYDNREKLYLGSILHDLGFKSKDNATYEDMSPAALATLDPDIKDDILNHPIRFAQKLAQVPDIHQDVIAIVRDHHGVIADKAYPKEIYANQVNLIFALFILSHEFSLKLYSISFNKKKIPDVLDKLCQDFDRGSYKKILPEFKVAIENLFLKEE